MNMERTYKLTLSKELLFIPDHIPIGILNVITSAIEPLYLSHSNRLSLTMNLFDKDTPVSFNLSFDHPGIIKRYFSLYYNLRTNIFMYSYLESNGDISAVITVTCMYVPDKNIVYAKKNFKLDEYLQQQLIYYVDKYNVSKDELDSRINTCLSELIRESNKYVVFNTSIDNYT